MKDGEKLKSFERYNVGLYKRIQHTDELLDRINKLVDFLYKCDDEKVSTGDVLGYICGYFGLSSVPEDEIETFD